MMPSPEGILGAAEDAAAGAAVAVIVAVARRRRWVRLQESIVVVELGM